MQPLPPGLPPHIATGAIQFQEQLRQQEALRQVLLSQQNGAAGQFNLGQAGPVIGPRPNTTFNGVAAVIGWFRIAFFLFRLGIVAVVLWAMWQIFGSY